MKGLMTQSLARVHVSLTGLTQQTKAADYWSADVTSVGVSHLDALSATGSVTHESCLQGMLG